MIPSNFIYKILLRHEKFSFVFISASLMTASTMNKNEKESTMVSEIQFLIN